MYDHLTRNIFLGPSKPGWLQRRIHNWPFECNLYCCGSSQICCTFFATWGNRFADLFDPQLKMVSAGQIGGISKRFKIVPKLLGGSSTVSLKLILPYILEPQHVCPIFWKYKMNDCRFSFSPTSAIGKSCTNFLYSPPFLLNLKKMSKLILNPVAICYNIMHTFILEFNIAQIFKCTLKYRSTWPLKLLLHDIYFS